MRRESGRNLKREREGERADMADNATLQRLKPQHALIDTWLGPTACLNVFTPMLLTHSHFDFPAWPAGASSFVNVCLTLGSKLTDAMFDLPYPGCSLRRARESSQKRGGYKIPLCALGQDLEGHVASGRRGSSQIWGVVFGELRLFSHIACIQA